MHMNDRVFIPNGRRVEGVDATTGIRQIAFETQGEIVGTPTTDGETVTILEKSDTDGRVIARQYSADTGIFIMNLG